MLEQLVQYHLDRLVLYGERDLSIQVNCIIAIKEYKLAVFLYIRDHLFDGFSVHLDRQRFFLCILAQQKSMCGQRKKTKTKK